ncbi:ROK family protein [Larkinella terrae]|uniref:ROK family protein n=1 Tax=Larkinella terrae TaxID=2025311 RepID=A0A7K0EV41_9BACT|nr:ROK family protein [Larkinella terrae]MRS65629.1 ROK family protein [Larkinella terrae]
MEANYTVSIVDKKKSRLKRGILKEMYRLGARTLAQLAKALHASVPSITMLIDELATEHWVQEIGTGAAQYGRKPALFGLRPGNQVIIVVDISVHDIKLVIFDLTNRVLDRLDVNLRLEDSVAFLEALKGPLEDIVQRVQEKQLKVIGVGCALPGLVDPRTGINYTYKNLNRPEESLQQLLTMSFDAPVYLLNDTKATILGEHRFGLAKGKNHVLSINIDWGVGLGVINNGEILQGLAGFAGELGHIQLQADGELCSCGKVGCLDTLTSASSLIRRVKAGLREGRVSKLAEENFEDIDVELVIDKAKAGDELAIDLLTELGNELGKGLSIAVHLFNPELIIVNGVVAKAERLITRPIEQAIDKYCLADFRTKLVITVSRLGEMAKLCGTQAYVVQCLLDHEEIP